jgi:hypothetical protein
MVILLGAVTEGQKHMPSKGIGIGSVFGSKRTWLPV